MSKATVPFHIPTSNVQGFQILHLLAKTLTFLFLVITLLAGVKWHLPVVWMCVSLMTDDAECLSMCVLAVCRSSLEKSLFQSLVRFLIGSFALSLVSGLFDLISRLLWGPLVKDPEAKTCPDRLWIKQSQEMKEGRSSHSTELLEFGPTCEEVWKPSVYRIPERLLQFLLKTTLRF